MFHVFFSPSDGDGGSAAPEAPEEAAEAPASGESEAAEAPAVEATEAATETPEAMSIDDLLSTHLVGQDYEGGHKGLNYQSILDGLPEDARKLLGNLRASYSQKTAALANERRELEKLRTEVMSRRQTLLNGDGVAAITAAASADLKANPDFDPWSEAGIEALAEQKAAKMLQKYIQPLQDQFAVAQYRAELDKFKGEHPDLMGDAEIKSKVTDLMRGDPELRLKNAYWMAKGMVGKSRAADRAEASANDRQKKRDILQGTRTGRRAGGAKPAGKVNAWAAFQAAKAASDTPG